jgi:hypothetical protein
MDRAPSLGWSNGLRRGRTDKGRGQLGIVEAVDDADRVGIDCPFGWPQDFSRFVQQHLDRTLSPAAAASLRERDSLAYRVTDLAYMRTVHVRPKAPAPLSVSTDKLGRAAMRMAGLQALLDPDFDRTGDGKFVEVYPAAALHTWGLLYTTYKKPKNRPALGDLVKDLLERTDGLLDLGAARTQCEHTDDVFDAVICALVARAATKPGGVTKPSTPADIAAASAEEWMAIPRLGLTDLFPN